MAAVNVFVAARGNRFMTEIADWIAEAATLTGRDATVISDRLPTNDGSVNLVVAPHEFFALYPATRAQLRDAAAASICISTEQPGTSWFDVARDFCRRGVLALDISDQGVDALRADGVRTERLRLGGVPSMHTDLDGSDRPIDVLFMGAIDDRRGAALADLAPHLWRVHADIRIVAGDRPIDVATPNTVFGADKHRLLASSKLILNLHRGRAGDATPYFEWARAVEAMANGCVVVTEPSTGYEPLIPGSHVVEAELAAMPAAIDALLGDDAARSRIADAARAAIFGELAMVRSLGPLLDRIEQLLPTTTVPQPDRVFRAHQGWLETLRRRPPAPRVGAFRP
ncbi:MAG TPA: glycosyltransferase, partial [Ilumatobacteraceae bacterium]